MTPKQFISQHIIAVDFEAFFDSNGEPKYKSIGKVSIETAEKAIALAEYELAKELLKLHESARIEVLEKIVYNFENKSIHEQERTQSEQKA